MLKDENFQMTLYLKNLTTFFQNQKSDKNSTYEILYYTT